MLILKPRHVYIFDYSRTYLGSREDRQLGVYTEKKEETTKTERDINRRRANFYHTRI